MSENSWTKWSEAIRRFEEAGLSAGQAHPWVLIDWAKSGKLPARAHSLTKGQTCDQFAAIPAELWVDASGRDGRIDWSLEGRLWAPNVYLHSRSMNGYEMSAVGIEFDSDRLSEIVPPLAPEPAVPAASKPKGGTPPKIGAWHDFYLAVIKLADEGNLRSFTKQADLRRSLLASINDALSDDAIIQPVRRIWHMLEKE